MIAEVCSEVFWLGCCRLLCTQAGIKVLIEVKI